MSKLSDLSLYNRTDILNRGRLALISVGLVAGLANQTAEAPPLPAPPDWIEIASTKPGQSLGQASWYGPRFHGKKTATGERFNQNRLTAAHRSLPLGTRVEVTNLKNGRKVQVRINDRGPYVNGRVIDLSRAAAQRLGMVAAGTTPVSIEVQGE